MTNQLDEARALGWTPPLGGAEGDAAAVAIQKVHRGKMARRAVEFTNLELARLQWIDYYGI